MDKHIYIYITYRALRPPNLLFRSYFDSLQDEPFLPVELYVLFQFDNDHPSVPLMVIELPQLYLHPAIIPLSRVARSDALLLIWSPSSLLVFVSSPGDTWFILHHEWVQRDGALH